MAKSGLSANKSFCRLKTGHWNISLASFFFPSATLQHTSYGWPKLIIYLILQVLLMQSKANIAYFSFTIEVFVQLRFKKGEILGLRAIFNQDKYGYCKLFLSLPHTLKTHFSPLMQWVRSIKLVPKISDAHGCLY